MDAETMDIDAEALFEQVAAEPFETVFSKPPQVEQDALMLHPEDEANAHVMLRNLDTGETRRLLDDTVLTDSFVGDIVGPEQVGGGGTSWHGWWAEKRQRDEQLCRAAEFGCVESLREALDTTDGGPPPGVNSRSLHGRTALHVAASAGHRESVEVLLDVGASVDQRTDAGLTALHAACQRGHLEVARLLVARGACIDGWADDGDVPLHGAARGGHTAVVSLLLDRGGPEQLRVRNNLGQRPVDVAQSIEVALLLRSQGSPIDLGGTATTGGTAVAAGGCRPDEDGYTRTHWPDGSGAVLLHNARSDVVRRLLHRAQHLASSEQASSPGGASPGGYSGGTTPGGSMAGGATPRGGATPGSVRRSGSRSHASSSPRPGLETPGGSHGGRPTFSRLRTDGHGIEEVGPDSFTHVKLLGRGSFGEVYQVRHRRTNQEFAMKILQKSKVTRGNLLRYAQTERNVLSYIRHPYIVSLHYAFQTASHLVLVLHLCTGGNLQRYITEHRRLQEPLARLYCAEVLLALGHLHERSIVFRDLKPENVVLDGQGHCMLTDFGLSKEGVSGIHGANSFCGSLAFLAPELLLQRGHGRTVDIYGLGVLLFCMLVGQPPFYHKDKETLLANIRLATLQVPAYVTRPAASLAESLMVREPSQRLGARRTADVQEHEFFSDLDFEALMRREVPLPSGALSPRRSASSPRSDAGPFSPGAASHRSGRGAGRVSGWEFSTASSTFVR